MTNAFIDESWLNAPSSDEYFLAVVSVITTDRRALKLIARRLKRAPKLRAKSEMKASVTPPQLVRKLLGALASSPDISIVAAIWHGKRSEVRDHEALYQALVGRCALLTVRRSPRIDLHIDKRYTNLDQQRELERAIRESIAIVPGNIVRVFQEESHVTPELVAPDFVAWALTQRYCRANGEFYNLIRTKIAHFDDLSRQKKSGSP